LQPRLRSQGSQSPALRFVNGGQQRCLVPREGSGQWQVIRGVVRAKHTAGKTIGMLDYLPQFVEQPFRWRYVKLSIIRLLVKRRARYEHQGEHRKVMRVHCTDDATRLGGVLGREFDSTETKQGDD